MRMTKRLAERVVGAAVGGDALPALEKLYNTQECSEFEVAKAYEDDVHSARNVLYRMHNNNMVSFTKKKDKQKGWYVYYWTLNYKRIKELAVQVKEDRKRMLQHRLEREKGYIYYICSNNCVRLDFEMATGFYFKCPECNEILVEHDNAKTINNIEKELARLERQVTV